MVQCGVTEIQNRPSIFKEISLGEIVDKRSHKSLGFFIGKKYENEIKELLAKLEKEEKIAKLKKLKEHQDLEFLELGVDDGL